MILSFHMGKEQYFRKSSILFYSNMTSLVLTILGFQTKGKFLGWKNRL